MTTTVLERPAATRYQAPVEGSEGFKEELLSRIEKADRRIGLIPASRFREELAKRMEIRRAQK
jgi:hypothetical protein